MKIAGTKFKTEELLLCLLISIFFLLLIIGAKNFEPTARFFPYVLAIPGFVMTLLYIMRGYLPPKVNDVIRGAPAIKESKELSEPARQLKKDNEKRATIISYALFIAVFLYIVVSYLVGFYLSTLAFLLIHLHFSRSFKPKSLLGNIVLIIVLLGMVYLFDTAFGYHFDRGALLSFP